MVGAIDSGWVIATTAVAVAAGGAGTWVFERERRARTTAHDEGAEEAAGPVAEMNATSRAAEALAGAAAALIAPFQATVSEQQGELGQLREAVTQCRESERRCQAELALARAEMSAHRTTLTQVTERLGIEPPSSPPALVRPTAEHHPHRRAGDR